MPNITFTHLADVVNASRIEWLDGRVTNMLARPTHLLNNLRKRSKEANQSGPEVVVPLEFYNHSTPTRFTDGWDQIDYTFSGTGYPARQTPADIVQPVGFSGHEVRINQGSAKVYDIPKQRRENVMNHFERSVNRAFLIQDNAVFTDITPINGDDYSDGMFEAAAPGSGSQNNTVVGISKSTFSDRPGWQNQYQTAGGAFSVNGRAKLYALIRAAKALEDAQGTLGTSDWQWYFSPSGFENLKNVLHDKEWWGAADKIDPGKTVEVYQGVPIIQIRDDMPTTGPWTAMLLDHAAIRYLIWGSWDGTMGPFETMQGSGYDAMVAHLNWMGNLLPRYLGTSGILINGDTY